MMSYASRYLTTKHIDVHTSHLHDLHLAIMDAVHAYTASTSAYLALQAVPLFVSPKLMVTMLCPDARPPTDLEVYFSRSLSLTLVTLAVLSMFLSGIIPLSSVSAESESEHAPSPYATPTILATSAYHALSLVYTYTNYMSTGSVCFALGMIGSGFLTAWGLWCLMFGGGEGRAKVSGWPFRNEEERKRKAEKMAQRRARKGL